MLEQELESHLGYAKHSPDGIGTENSRNGYSKKIVKGSLGETEIQIPRDRLGEFESPLLPKYSGNINDLDERVISMYAKGMSTRDINEHIEEIYGVQISSTMVSSITEKIRPMIEEWQKRPLSELYTVLYMDGIHFKVREQGKIVTKCSYIFQKQKYRNVLFIKLEILRSVSLTKKRNLFVRILKIFFIKILLFLIFRFLVINNIFYFLIFYEIETSTINEKIVRNYKFPHYF